MSKGKVIFIKNAILLTATSLLLRLVGMVFRVYIAASIGAEGMGLYQQIFSVYTFVSVFAVSGIGIAVTRLISEEVILGSRRGIDQIIFKSIFLTLVFAAFSMVTVIYSSKYVAVYIMSDERAINPLKMMSLSLPFMGMSSVFKGYFFARKKALPHSLSQILEQAVRIAFIFGYFNTHTADVSSSCTAVLFGDALAEATSFLYLALHFIADRKKLKNLTGRKTPPYNVYRNIIRIVSPIAGGKYLNSFLRTAENMLVPLNLVKAGMTRDGALSFFGSVKGMALPLLLFPAGLISSVTSLLIPEISEASAAGHKGRIRYAAEKSIALTFISAIPFAVGFFFAAEPLCELIYKEQSVGRIVRLLAPLVPLMYIDSVSDALLKALDRQTLTFRHTLFDSLGRLATVLAFLPLFGEMGFIAIMYGSNIFTSMLNLVALIKATGCKIDPLKTLIVPIILSLSGALLSKFLLAFFEAGNMVYIILLFAGIFTLYIPYFRRLRQF